MFGRRLNRLTAEQRMLIPLVRDEWIGVSLSTVPADRSEAQRGVEDAYRKSGLNPPAVIWLRSPFEEAVGSFMLGDASAGTGRDMMEVLLGSVLERQLGFELGDRPLDRAWRLRDRVGEVRDQVESQLGCQVWDQVEWDQVWNQFGNEVQGQVDPNLRLVGSPLQEQIWGALRCSPVRCGGEVQGQLVGKVRGKVREEVRDEVLRKVLGPVGEVREQVGGQLWGQLWGNVGGDPFGQHDAYLLAEVDFFRRCGLSAAHWFDGHSAVARSAGWWSPHDGYVILTERPLNLHLDEEGRLHRETGPALVYPDGWGIWASHGVRVPREVIEQPETLEPERILREVNVEVRRVMMERFGHGRLLRERGAKLLGTDDFGKLWRLDLRRGEEPLVMVEVVNSTAEPDGSFKDYFLRVSPECRTAQEAVAWTFGMTPEEYRVSVQT